MGWSWNVRVALHSSLFVLSMYDGRVLLLKLMILAKIRVNSHVMFLQPTRLFNVGMYF